MPEQKLFMVLLGGKPAGRHIEQHDMFFGIAEKLADLIPAFKKFWPEMAAVKIHIDSWREVTQVDGYDITILPNTGEKTGPQLFFINLGGYKPGDMEEFHYKMLAAADEKSKAIQAAKKTAFYQHCGFAGADSHIDDKYGVDVDDIYAIQDILPIEMKFAYRIQLTPALEKRADELHIGYLKLDKLKKESIS